MFLSEWRKFPSAPCLAGAGDLRTARVSMLLKSRASLTCFRACFLPGRAKDLSASRYTLARPMYPPEPGTVTCSNSPEGHFNSCPYPLNDLTYVRSPQNKSDGPTPFMPPQALTLPFIRLQSSSLSADTNCVLITE